MAKEQQKSLSRKAQGEETRAILINTGARLFALNGFHGVSMRKLAAEAGVNLATVGYHFGSKAGLYEAILQELIDIREQIFPSLEAVEARLDAAQGDTTAIADCVSWYVRTLVYGILSQDKHNWPAFIISRELAQPTDLYPKLEKEFLQPALASLFHLVEKVQPKGADHEEIVIISYCIISMIIKFLEGFSLITKDLGWENYEGHGVEKIATVLSKRIRGFLGLPMENI